MSRVRGSFFREAIFYAQIDDVVHQSSGENEVVFDAVNARSKGFWQERDNTDTNPFAIHSMEDDVVTLEDFSLPVDTVRSNVTRYWDSVFNNDNGFNQQDNIENNPFKELSLCIISVVLSNKEYPEIDKSKRTTWYKVTLESKTVRQSHDEDEQGIATVVWDYRHQDPRLTMIFKRHKLIGIEPCSGRELMLLQASTDTSSWTVAKEEEIRQVVKRNIKDRRIEQLICFDVGQGTCVGLADQHGQVLLYSDFGCGVRRNVGTTPPNLQYCCDKNPPVILSHWHEDHWAGIKQTQQNVSGIDWILPPTPSSLTFNKSELVQLIRKQNGRVYKFPGGTISIDVGNVNGNYTQKIELQRCKGKLDGNKNECGLAVCVYDFADKQCPKQWILPGDASYSSFSIDKEPSICAVVATHHGGYSKARNYPKRPLKQLYARLLFSFGKDNTYGIPVNKTSTKTIQRYKKVGWRFDSNWPRKHVVPKSSSSDVLSTATMSRGYKSQTLSSSRPRPVNHIAASWDNGVRCDGAHLSTCLTNQQKFTILR